MSLALMQIYRKYYEKDSIPLAVQEGRWQALYLLIKKLEK